MALHFAKTVESAWIDGQTNGNNFDFLRQFAVALVMFSHALFVYDGSLVNEPFKRLTGQVHSGQLGILIFFGISGFLIAKSWVSTPSIGAFLRKRFLRIVPALLAVVFITAFILGPLMSKYPLTVYFSDPGVYSFLANAVFFAHHQRLPGVFEELPVAGIINVSLWTLAYEVLCYLLLMSLGLVRKLSARSCLFVFLALMSVKLFLDIDRTTLVGEYVDLLTVLGPSFFIGAAFALSGARIPLNGFFALIASLVLLVSIFAGGFLAFFPIFGVYLILYIAFAILGPLAKIGAKGDFSYGIYLWGWPIQQMVILYMGDQSWGLTFVVGYLATLAVAIASWHLIEKPALGLKSNFSKSDQVSVLAPIFPMNRR